MDLGYPYLDLIDEFGVEDTNLKKEKKSGSTKHGHCFPFYVNEVPLAGGSLLLFNLCATLDSSRSHDPILAKYRPMLWECILSVS